MLIKSVKYNENKIKIFNKCQIINPLNSSIQTIIIIIEFCNMLL